MESMLLLMSSFQVTSCKSAKDRTSMSVTYEYCQILRELHDISQNSITTALDEFRRSCSDHALFYPFYSVLIFKLS